MVLGGSSWKVGDRLVIGRSQVRASRPSACRQRDPEVAVVQAAEDLVGVVGDAVQGRGGVGSWCAAIAAARRSSR
jgi:hypothetical protein